MYGTEHRTALPTEIKKKKEEKEEEEEELAQEEEEERMKKQNGSHKRNCTERKSKLSLLILFSGGCFFSILIHCGKEVYHEHA